MDAGSDSRYSNLSLISGRVPRNSVSKGRVEINESLLIFSRDVQLHGQRSVESLTTTANGIRRTHLKLTRVEHRSDESTVLLGNATELLITRIHFEECEHGVALISVVAISFERDVDWVAIGNNVVQVRVRRLVIPDRDSFGAFNKLVGHLCSQLENQVELLDG